MASWHEDRDETMLLSKGTDAFERVFFLCLGLLSLALAIFLGVLIYWAVARPDLFFGS